MQEEGVGQGEGEEKAGGKEDVKAYFFSFVKSCFRLLLAVQNRSFLVHINKSFLKVVIVLKSWLRGESKGGKQGVEDEEDEEE